MDPGKVDVGVAAWMSPLMESPPFDADGEWELEEELEVEVAMGLGLVTVAAATTWEYASTRPPFLSG